MHKTKIEWAGDTWNPVRAETLREERLKLSNGSFKVIPAGKVGYHCERISPGCGRCYSCTGNARTLPAWGTGLDFTVPNRERIRIFLDEKVMLAPTLKTKSRRIFVASMTDVFGDFVPSELIERVWAVMRLCPQHQFLVLTKRSARLRSHFQAYANTSHAVEALHIGTGRVRSGCWIDPLPNVDLGVSVEDDEWAAKRIPDLMATPAARRWISYEPALGPLNVRPYIGCALHGKGIHPNCDCPRLNWVVIGGESGAGARPFNLQWARDVIEPCVEAGVPVFFKQAGARPYVATKDKGKNTRAWPHSKELLDGDRIYTNLKDRKGGDLSELPCDLSFREYPGMEAQP